MNAFFWILLSTCGLLFYGNSLPYRDFWSKYKTRDDYYEDYYLRKIPKLKTSPEKIKEFLINHLSWFPLEDLQSQTGHSSDPRSHKKRSQIWNVTIEQISDKNCDSEKPKKTIKQKFKNFTNEYHLNVNWTSFKNKSSKSMHKVKDYIKKKKFKEMIKNATHPLRYKGSKHGNKSRSGECYDNYGEPIIRKHPKSSHVETIKVSTTISPIFNSLLSIPGFPSDLAKFPYFPSNPKSPGSLLTPPNLPPPPRVSPYPLYVVSPPDEPLPPPQLQRPPPLSQSSDAAKNSAAVPQSSAASQFPAAVPQSSAGSQIPAAVPQSSAGSQIPAAVPQSSAGSQIPAAVPQSSAGSQIPAAVPQSSGPPQNFEAVPQSPDASHNSPPSPPPPQSPCKSQNSPGLPHPFVVSEIPQSSGTSQNLPEVPQPPMEIPKSPVQSDRKLFLSTVLNQAYPISCRMPIRKVAFPQPAQLFPVLLEPPKKRPMFPPLSQPTEDMVPTPEVSKNPIESPFLPSVLSQPYVLKQLKFQHYSSLDRTPAKLLNLPSPRSSNNYFWLPEFSPSHLVTPRKIKVLIDLKSPKKLSKVAARNVNRESYLDGAEKKSSGGESTNSTNVLETAGEMASDLAGRVTSLWHCVLGSHRIPDTRDVKFFLYTRRNLIQPELLTVNYDLINKKVQSQINRNDVDCFDILPDQIPDFERISDENREIVKSNFLNIRAPTKILIHGYTGSYKDSRMAKIKDAYLNSGRYNVIQVDWEMLAAPPCYIRVTHHSKFVGETIAQFLNGLYLVGLNMSLIHLIGFSLGAQVAGFTGNNATVTPVCRITGLDPALPLFLHTSPSGHLDRLDAKFVDVIHTCGGILAMLDPLGHVDFYPNGGTRQPGCEFSNLKCSHSRAPQYFAESVISQKKFTGQLCLTWEEYVSGDCDNATDISYMGEPCSRRSVYGKYYLLTKSKEPFAL